MRCIRVRRCCRRIRASGRGRGDLPRSWPATRIRWWCRACANFSSTSSSSTKPQRKTWIQHWIREALKALETNLADSKDTGRYCCGDNVTIADICLVSQVAGAGFFKVDLAPYPTVRRVAEACMKEDAFVRAHPLKQPGAPASV